MTSHLSHFQKTLQTSYTNMWWRHTCPTSRKRFKLPIQICDDVTLVPLPENASNFLYKYVMTSHLSHFQKTLQTSYTNMWWRHTCPTSRKRFKLPIQICDDVTLVPLPENASNFLYKYVMTSHLSHFQKTLQTSYTNMWWRHTCPTSRKRFKLPIQICDDVTLVPLPENASNFLYKYENRRFSISGVIFHQSF